MFSVHECLDTVSAVMEAITQDTCKDLYQFMHVVDDWVAALDEEWENFYSDMKVVVNDKAAAQ